MQFSCQFWKDVLTLPQTALLILGIGLGYGAFKVWLSWLGITAGILILMMSACIVGFTFALWFWQIYRFYWSSQPAPNLMQSVMFLKSIAGLEKQLPDSRDRTWQQAKKQMIESHAFICEIVQHETILLPELVETLHLLLERAKYIVKAMQVTAQVKTTDYSQQAHQYLQRSCDRLQNIHQQLQQLRDQIVLCQLEQEAIESTELPTQLRLLILENQDSSQSFHSL